MQLTHANLLAHITQQHTVECFVEILICLTILEYWHWTDIQFSECMYLV